MNNLSNNTRVVGNVATVQTKLMWRIENIREYCKLSRLESPKFTTKTGNLITKWILYINKVNDKGSQQSDNDEQYLGISLTSLNTENIRASIQFCIVTALSRETNSIHLEDLENCEFQLNISWGIDRFVSWKNLSCITQKYATIICTITTNEFIKVDSENYKAHLEKSLRLAEFDKLGNLFQSKKFSDVIIAVEGREIHAHKNFLASKSPVFEAMFTHDTSEANNNRVEISDVTYNSMFNMLKYIYTGIINVPYSENVYMDLVIVSEKYCVEKLKHKCEKKLSIFLAVNNVFKYLNFSDKYNASHLKEKVIEYIVNHGEDIAALPYFNKHCSELQSNVVGEVFRALVTKRRKIE